jgi:hypothetical protein
MSLQFNEKGKFFTDWVQTSAVPATIQTSSQQIRGNIHVREGERLKDELDRDEAFLAVTDATVIGNDGRPLFECPFMAVNRSHVVWVRPEPAQPAADAG